MTLIPVGSRAFSWRRWNSRREDRPESSPDVYPGSKRQTSDQLHAHAASSCTSQRIIAPLGGGASKWGKTMPPNVGIATQQDSEKRVTQRKTCVDQYGVCDLAPIRQSFDSLIWRKISVVLGRIHEKIDPAHFPKPNRRCGLIRMRW